LEERGIIFFESFWDILPWLTTTTRYNNNNDLIHAFCKAGPASQFPSRAAGGRGGRHEKALKTAADHGIPASLFPLEAPWSLFPWYEQLGPAARGPSGRLGGASAGPQQLLGLHLKAWGLPPHS